MGAAGGRVKAGEGVSQGLDTTLNAGSRRSVDHDLRV